MTITAATTIQKRRWPSGFSGAPAASCGDVATAAAAGGETTVRGIVSASGARADTRDAGTGLRGELVSNPAASLETESTSAMIAPRTGSPWPRGAPPIAAIASPRSGNLSSADLASIRMTVSSTFGGHSALCRRIERGVPSAWAIMIAYVDPLNGTAPVIIS